MSCSQPTKHQKDNGKIQQSTLKQQGSFVGNLVRQMLWKIETLTVTATYALREAVNITSEQLEYGIDEFEKANLERTYTTLLQPKCNVPNFKGVPMVKDSPVRFECEYHSTIRLPGNPPMGTVDIVIGRVIGVHISDDVINLETGKLDIARTQPIARLGYYDYAVVKECFEMRMPGSQIMRDGLEGSSKKNREANEVMKSSES